MDTAAATEVDHAGAWEAADLEADKSWIVTFDAAAREELDLAIAAVDKACQKVFGFGREDFPLPTLGPVLEAARETVENGRGVILLRGIPVSKYSDEQIYKLYWGLGCHLGTPVSQNASGQLISEIRDRGRDYRVTNVRGYTTRAALRPHCDSPDAVGLLCLHPSKSGGASSISSSAAIYNEIVRTRPDFLPALMAGFQYDLRGEGVTGDSDEVTHNFIPVFSLFEGRLSCRYNHKMIIGGAQKSGRVLTPLETEALEAITDLARSNRFRFDMDFRAGDIQILSNHSVLHARTAFEDWPEPERRRRLLRLWLNLPNGRPLPPEFAERYNTGPRGGVRVRPDAEHSASGDVVPSWQAAQ